MQKYKSEIVLKDNVCMFIVVGLKNLQLNVLIIPIPFLQISKSVFQR